MQGDLIAFSNLVCEINERAHCCDPECLASWAVESLSKKIGFDSAWYGWAELNPDNVVIHANSTLNLPANFYETWCEISAQDLLAAGILEKPGHASSYSRSGKLQTDGMVALSDTFGLQKMATAMHTRPGRTASFFLSGYRSGQTTPSWSADELVFLQCVVDQLSTAMKRSATEVAASGRPDSVSIFTNKDGIGILGLQVLREQLGDFWPDWEGDQLPKQLRTLIDLPGEHLLVERNIAVSCEATADANNMNLRKLTLRPMTAFDLLTKREQEVARVLANGKSHKETARILGVAPATIRNQTQAIYAKLQVGNRAKLATLVQGEL